MRNISTESQTWARRAIELMNKHPLLEAAGAGFLGSLMIAGCSKSDSPEHVVGFFPTYTICNRDRDTATLTQPVQQDGQVVTISNGVSGSPESPKTGDSVTVVVDTDGTMGTPIPHGDNIDTNPVTDSPNGQEAFTVVDESDQEHSKPLFTVVNDGDQITTTFNCN